MSSTESDRKEEPSQGARRRPRPRREVPAGADQTGAESPHEEGASNASRDAGQPEAETGQESLFSWTFRDFLIPYILLALSIQRAHGYFIEQYLRGLGLANIEMSTLYRTLRQMEKDGLVYSTWEPGPEGPARRIYSLTDAGRWWLDAGASALAGYRSLIDRFFGSYSGPSGNPDANGRKKGASS
jgi:PadR family transcriptional regulator, regulatory protein PadR